MRGRGTHGRAVTRFDFLDAQRGIAAFCVVILHLFSFQMLPRVLPSAYLAVDFFFVLSGFVLAHAYGHRLGADLSFRGFAMSRVIRLYPLALLSMLIGLAIILLKFVVFPDKVPALPVIMEAAALNLFVLPHLTDGERLNSEVFPLNGPMWSLSLELLFNLLWAGVIVRFKKKGLILVLAVSAGYIAYGYITHGARNLGYNADTYLYGIARVAFGFSAGVLVYGWKDNFPIRIGKWAAFVLATALLIGSFRFSNAYLNIANTVVLYPFIVLLLAQYQHEGRITSWLGRISYPLYLLHFPILVAVSGVWQVLGQVNPLIVGVFGVVAALIVSHIAARFDESVGQYLRGRLLPPRVPTKPQPSEILPLPLG